MKERTREREREANECCLVDVCSEGYCRRTKCEGDSEVAASREVERNGVVEPATSNGFVRVTLVG